MLKLFMLMLLANVISHIVFHGDELKGTVVISMILGGIYSLVLINNAHMKTIRVSQDNEIGY